MNWENPVFCSNHSPQYRTPPVWTSQEYSCQPDELPRRSRVSGSAAVCAKRSCVPWTKKPKLLLPVSNTSLPPSFSLCLSVSSRNGSSYVTHSGDRRRAFRLNSDQCWTETEESAGRLSPGQTDPTTHVSYTPPIPMCTSHFLYLWSCFNLLFGMWRRLCVFANITAMFTEINIT